MPDQKPPKMQGDERSTLHVLLQYQRDSLVRKIRGLSEEAARETPLPSGTNLLWLVKHMAGAEYMWVLHRFAGQDAPTESDQVGPDDTVESAVAAYKAVWPRVDTVVEAASSLDELCQRTADDALVNLRWVLMHLLEETARHAGHADILRELIDGDTGR
jgi:uncharacterized damage-inducible protein DinB